MSKFLVIRKACLMEDEGRDHLVSTESTPEDAEQKVMEWIADGYFSRSDMEIVEMPS